MELKDAIDELLYLKEECAEQEAEAIAAVLDELKRLGVLNRTAPPYDADGMTETVERSVTGRGRRRA